MANIEKLNQFIKDMETIKENYKEYYTHFNYKKYDNNLLLIAYSEELDNWIIICRQTLKNNIKNKLGINFLNCSLIEQELFVDYYIKNYNILSIDKFISLRNEINNGDLTKEEAQEIINDNNEALKKWDDFINQLKNPSDIEQLFINCIIE